MKTKLITIVAVLVTLTSAIIAQQYVRVMKIYKGNEVITYKVSEVDSVKFDRLALCTISASAAPAEGGAAVTIDGTAASKLVEPGTAVTIAATPNANYTFVNWTINGNVQSLSNPATITINEETSVVANFMKSLNYCTYSGNMTYSKSRRLNSFTLTNGETSLAVSGVQTSYSDAVYKDKTSSILQVAAGSTLFFSELNWTGSWMHGYVYIDYNQDGVFNTDVNKNGTNSGELVSYNHYNGFNSEGNATERGCGVLVNNMPSWTLPSDLAPGLYRLRFKIDWESLDPCGSTQSGNDIATNSGCICDITVQITSSLPVVTTAVNPLGAGTVEITDEDPTDSEIILTANRNAGYIFNNWTVGGSVVSTENPYTATLTEDTEFVANFRTAQNVAVSVSMAEGGLEATISANTIMEGETVTLEATPDDDHVFSHWSVGGVEVSRENPYEAVVIGPTEYVANFKIPVMHTIMLQAGKGGTVDIESIETMEGDYVTLEATPSAGYEFENWTIEGNVVSTENPFDYQVENSVTVVANFRDKYSQLTNVPTIYINTENGVAVTSKEDYVIAHVSVRGAENDADNISEVLTEIKGRGNSTWNMEKKPYRLKFDKKIQFLGNAAKEKNWVLLANYADKTLMRNALAFETAREMMNFGFTPSVTFVDVVLNGENLGSYMLTDQVEVKTKRVPVTEQEVTTSLSDPEITGGYLIEVDGFADSEISWFQTTKGMKVTIKYPKDDEINSDQSSYISNYTQQMENALFSANYTDAELGWRKYIDEASMVDWYIACELFGNSDAWWSTYMYKERDSVFKFGPLWDFDIAFNNDSRLGDATNKLMRTYAHDPKTWIAKWCSDAGFMSSVYARWAELRENGLAVFMNNYIDNTAEYLDESQKNNFQKWNILNKVVYNELAARGSYAAEVEFLRNYVNNRIAYLDNQFQLSTPLYSVVTSSSDKSMGTVSASATTVNANEVVTLTATPNDGYVFVNWTIGGAEVSTNNPYEVTVTSNIDIKANFAPITKSLPKVYINTPNSVSITSKEIWTEGSTMRILDEYGDEVYNDTMNIRGRGNSTWNYPKKPYALKLESKASILGMPKHKRWVLLANWMDRTLMRNAVSFEMARLCMDWAPRGEFVEFYLNGVHQGNYFLCEQIKIDKNRVNITEFEDGNGTGEEGGFLLEFDTNYQAEINYFFSSVKNFPVTIKDPDEEIITSWSHPYYTYIKNFVGGVETLLRNGDFATAFDKIDIATYVDYWLIHELTTNEEPQHPKSCYMYKDAGGKIKAGPVWDFDWGTFNPNKNGLLISSYLWYGYLFNSPEFKVLVKERWAQLKPKLANMDSFIDDTANKIRESEAVNHNMWPIDNRHGYPNGDELMEFDAAVNRMKQALQNRINQVDAAINNL